MRTLSPTTPARAENITRRWQFGDGRPRGGAHGRHLSRVCSDDSAAAS